MKSCFFFCGTLETTYINDVIDAKTLGALDVSEVVPRAPVRAVHHKSI